MTTLFTATYVTLAVVLLITYLAIVARHAIPRAPKVFHLALTIPMIGGVVVLFLLAGIVSTSSRSLFGIDIEVYRLIFLWTQISWLSILLYYAYWWYMHGRNEEDGQLDRIERFSSEAASERVGDRPMEETDRDEGRKHRASIEDRLIGDRAERAEERRLDREERAKERADDRDERREERRDQR